MAHTVKRGDRHPISWTVGGDGEIDLVDKTVRALAKPANGQVAVELAVTTSQDEAGAWHVAHELTGELAAGTYSIEVEVTDDGGLVRTIPSDDYETLEVKSDLG